MDPEERADARPLMGAEQSNHLESINALRSNVSNYNPNASTLYGQGNILNYNPITTNIFNAAVLQEPPDVIRAKITTALKERHVPQAVYTAQLGSGCMDGTRVQVLLDIETWIKDLKAPQIFWLAGMLGSGKSAIAWTICARTRGNSDMVLGGSFFCSRSTSISANRDVRCIVPTLAQLLARESVEFSRALAIELARDPDILHQQVATQIEHLLYKPLLLLKDSAAPILFVIDALDECGGLSRTDGSSDDTESHRLVSDMLEALVIFSRSPIKLPVKFLITSRPETRIRDTLVSDATFSKVLQLHNVNRQQVAADIGMYISTRLSRTPRLRALFTVDNVNTLSRLCDGLFIVATTALEFALGAGIDRAPARFNTMLNSAQDGLSHRAMAPLDSMYFLILTEAARFNEPDADGLPDLQQMLASLLCARMAPSVAALADLLDLSAVHLRASLSHLHAVVHVPDDDSEPGLQPLHASFGDYLFGRAPSNFRVTASLGHDILSRACFRVMNKCLHFNVSKSRASYERNSSTRPESITLSLEYACLQWVYHVYDLPESLASTIDKNIQDIFIPRFMFWLEVLSLLGRILRATAMLVIAASKGSSVKSSALSQFFRDGYTFVASSREAIERSAAHIYLSALPFAAKNSMIYKKFSPLCTGLISVQTYGIGPHGGGLLMTLSGHEGPVLAVAYSCDGRLLASGSKGGTIRILDTTTGEETMAPFRRGDGPVRTVVFAPGNKVLVSGGDTAVVCVWTLLAGHVALKSLHGHTDTVSSVVFTSDGSLIASGSWDGSVRLWQPQTGQQLAVYSDHMGRVNTVAFSPDGKLLASVSSSFIFDFGIERQAVRLRHSHTGKPVDQQLQFDTSRNSFCGVCFSPCGTKIALGCGYNVQLYDALTGRDITSLYSPSKPVRSIQFSPDGQSMLMTVDRGELRIWNLPRAGKEASSTLVASETVRVSHATFSPDGLYIASGSANGSVQIWSAHSSRPVLQPLQTLDTILSSVAITPDGATLASGSQDGSIRVWNIPTGELELSLMISQAGGRVGLVAISADGHLIASASSRWAGGPQLVAAENILLLWNVHTRAIIGRLLLRGDDSWFVAMTFSPDRRWFAARTGQRLFIWDTDTGKTLACNELPDNGASKSLAFSPDHLFFATSGGKYIQLWETGAWTQRHTLQADTPILVVGFSPNSMHLMAADDKAVQFWDVRTGQQTHVVENSDSPTAPVTFSPDGHLIGRRSTEGSFILWEVGSGVQVATLHANLHPSTSVAFQLGSKYAMSYVKTVSHYEVCAYQRICIWDVNVARKRLLRDDSDPVAALVSATLRDGWLIGPSGELLLWVPEEYREHLQLPHCTMLISQCRVAIMPSDGGWHRGQSWTACWRGDPSDLMTNIV